MIIAPIARDREKNICPPALANTDSRLGVSATNPASTAYPGTNMNFRPSIAPGRVRERMMMTTSITNSVGMPTLLNFSMPPEMPLRLIR